MSSYKRILYIGVTSNLVTRVYEHKNSLVEGFSKKYNVKFLVYYETTSNVENAIAREKQLKSWRREKKEVLIDKMNPEWKDLYQEII
jgi:putative endonuclease